MPSEAGPLKLLINTVLSARCVEVTTGILAVLNGFPFRKQDQRFLFLLLRLRARNNPLAHSRFTNLEPHEAPNRDLIPELFRHATHVLLQRDFRVSFHETLIQQAIGLVKLFQLAFKMPIPF